MPGQVPQASPKEAQGFTLARLTAAHLPHALNLSLEMNWPYRLEDWAFAHQLGQGIGLEQAQRLVGTAMWWPNGDAFATAGMIIVSEDFQGRGLGARLFDALLDELGSRTVVLNSTAAGFELYRRRGFAPIGEVHQHQGELLAPGQRARRAGLRTASAGELDVLAQLDQEAIGRPRGELFKGLMAAGRFMVLEADGAVRGFAVSRRFGRGHVVGPVIAEGAEDAQALIEAAAADLVGRFVRVDTPAELGLGPWLEARGLKKVDAVTTMVRGDLPRLSGRPRAFALCSQSLG
jgi:ribosomal protein S18 acetylase RimI-like enzyme